MDDNERPRFLSAGRLPPAADVQSGVDEAWRRFRGHADGRPSAVYPALAEVDPALFGVAVIGTSGQTFTAGDALTRFTIMSVAKPFVLALVCEEVGLGRVRQVVGVNATGLPFNTVQAVEASPGGRTNPMVNPGAIATTSLMPGRSVEARWKTILAGLSRFAGRDLNVDGGMLDSARATNHRNRALANLLTSVGGLVGDPVEAVDLYTRQSCVEVTAVDLAVMARPSPTAASTR